MLIEKIRHSTKENHEGLEKGMFPVIMRITSYQDYARLLRFFYGYFKPLQDAISTTIDRKQLPDYDERRKPEWILNDLRDIGDPDHTAAVVYQDAPTITTNAEAMGTMYVLEGSSLGGKVICNTIGNNLQIKDKKGLSFFYGYGPGAAVKWKDFLATLNTYSGQPEEDIIVRKANEVFQGFQNWFNINYSIPGE